MPAVVSSEIKQKFMDDKRIHDSFSQAIRLAKESGCTDKQIKPLTLEKQKYKKIVANNTQALLRAMPLNSNLVQLEDNWWAIRFINEKADTHLKTEILKPDTVYLIERDGRHERELRKGELDTLTPSLMDDEGLELYKQYLATRATLLVAEYLNVYLDNLGGVVEPDIPIKANEVVTVSAHAGIRWVQRVIGISNETEAAEYRRLHVQEVNNDVLEGYKKAKLVWEEKADGITYHFDEDNIMYVKGIQDGLPRIITLYEEEFGFTKPINRIITLEQLKVLNDVNEQLITANESVKDINLTAEAEVMRINDQIAVLESQIALLTAERASTLANRDKANKQTRVLRDKYTAEFNKLFKKWEV